MASIFIAADDCKLLNSLEALLRHTAFETYSFTKTDEMLNSLRREIPKSVIAQAKLSKLETAAMVRQIKANLPNAPVIIVATSGELSHAMEALRAGAHDYIEWPFVDRILIESLEQATTILHNRNS